MAFSKWSHLFPCDISKCRYIIFPQFAILGTMWQITKCERFNHKDLERASHSVKHSTLCIYNLKEEE